MFYERRVKISDGEGSIELGVSRRKGILERITDKTKHYHGDVGPGGWLSRIWERESRLEN